MELQYHKEWISGCVISSNSCGSAWGVKLHSMDCYAVAHRMPFSLIHLTMLWSQCTVWYCQYWGHKFIYIWLGGSVAALYLGGTAKDNGCLMFCFRFFGGVKKCAFLITQSAFLLTAVWTDTVLQMERSGRVKFYQCQTSGYLVYWMNPASTPLYSGIQSLLISDV